MLPYSLRVRWVFLPWQICLDPFFTDMLSSSSCQSGNQYQQPTLPLILLSFLPLTLTLRFSASLCWSLRLSLMTFLMCTNKIPDNMGSNRLLSYLNQTFEKLNPPLCYWMERKDHHGIWLEWQGPVPPHSKLGFHTYSALCSAQLSCLSIANVWEPTACNSWKLCLCNFSLYHITIPH